MREPPLRERPLNGGLAGLRNPEDELVLGREAPALVQQLVFRIPSSEILTALCFSVDDLRAVVRLNIRHQGGNRIRRTLDGREPLGRQPGGQSFSYGLIPGAR